MTLQWFKKHAFHSHFILRLIRICSGWPDEKSLLMLLFFLACAVFVITFLGEPRVVDALNRILVLRHFRTCRMYTYICTCTYINSSKARIDAHKRIEENPLHYHKKNRAKLTYAL